MQSSEKKRSGKEEKELEERVKQISYHHVKREISNIPITFRFRFGGVGLRESGGESGRESDLKVTGSCKSGN